MAQEGEADNFLRVGDLITLQYVRFQSYLTCEGILDDSVFVVPKTESFEDHLFMVCTQQQYSANMEYEDFMVKLDGRTEMTDAEQKHFDALVKGKANEIRMNDTFMRHKIGKKVLFGELVQLRHVKSKKYVTVMDKVLARDERENTAICLSSDGSSMSWLQLLPRYKIDKEGDKISNNSELIIHVSEKGQDHVHCAERVHGHSLMREVNSSMEGVTPWRISIYESAQEKTEESLMCGELVYIKDPEFNCCLTRFIHPIDASKGLEGMLEQGSVLAADDVSVDSSLASATTLTKKEKTERDQEDISDEDSDDESISSAQEFTENYGDVTLEPQGDLFDSNMLWVLEHKKITVGGPVKWRKDQIFLRHFNSGMYLGSNTHHDDYVTESSNFMLLSEPIEKNCLFNLFELHSQTDNLQNTRAIQIRQGGMFLERSEYNDRWSNYPIQGNRNRLRATNLIITRYTEEHTVNAGELDVALDVHVGMSFRNLMGKFYRLTIVPSIREDKQSSVWPDLELMDRAAFGEGMTALIVFLKGQNLVTGSSPGPGSNLDVLVQQRQRLIRDQGTLEIMLQLLRLLIPVSERLSTGDAAAHQFSEGGLLATARQTISSTLKVVFELTKGNRTNQLYVAEFMAVVLAHCQTEVTAAELTQDMLSSNRELQETKLGVDEIRAFAAMLQNSQMSAMFMNLIKACCTCRGMGMRRNQVQIAKILTTEFEGIFVEILCDKESTVPSDWSANASFSLYMPSGKTQVTDEIVMGSFLYTSGMPLIQLNWSHKDKRLLPVSLFNKKNVSVSELYAKSMVVNSLERGQTSNSLFGPTGSTKLTNSPSKKVLLEAEQMSKDEKFRTAIGAYVIAQIDLMADMCMDRNYTVINMVKDHFSFDMLLSMIKKKKTPSQLRAVTVKLMTNLFVDCDPQVSVTLPRLTRTWTEVSDEDSPEISTVPAEQRYKFALLQVYVSDRIRAQANQPYSKDMYQLTVLLHKLLQFSFYGEADKLLDVIDPIVAALDRSTLEIDFDAVDISQEVMMNVNQPRIRTHRRTSVEVKRRGAAHDVNEVQALNSGSLEDEGDAKLELHHDDVEQKEPLVHRLLKFFESLGVTMSLLFIVVISVGLALYEYIEDMDANSSLGLIFFIIEIVIFVIFLVDVLVRFICHTIVRGDSASFFHDPFNLIDISVVVIDVATFVASAQLSSAAGFTRVIKVVRLLRLFRVMRVFRILNTIAANLTGAEVFKVAWVEPERYSRESDYNLRTMVEMMKVLETVQLTVEDRNMSLLLHHFHRWYQGTGQEEEEELRLKGALKSFQTAFGMTEELRVSNDQHDDIFIDLLMYSNQALVQTSLNVLMTHHSSMYSSLSNLKRTQLLVNLRREQQYEKLDKLLLMLKREIDTHDIWGRLSTDEHKHISQEAHRALLDIKQTIIRRREVLKFDEDFEPDVVIQNILRNLGCFEVCMSIIRLVKNIDRNNLLSAQSKNTRTLALEASDVLYWFILECEPNQLVAYEHIQFFLGTLDENIRTHKILEAIFAGNEFLMKSLPRQYINQCVDMIINQGRFAQYLSLLTSVVACGEKNMIDNQYEIIRQISSPGNLKKVVMYFVPVSHPEYQKKLKAMNAYHNVQDVSVEDLPADLAYHLQLMTLLNGCTVGRDNMTTIEAKVQSMYYFVDVVDALLDPACILIIKIRSGLFLYNAMLDVEMRLPSLKDAACIWRLLDSFQEVFTFAKDDLRQIEKNGWEAPTSCRQRVEYMVVCCMVVLGYFELYFDQTVFRPEVGQASSVERVQIREKKAYEMINSLFFKIRSIYEMMSPLLAKEHHQVMFQAMCALNEANPAKIVAVVENLHDGSSEEMYGNHMDKKGQREEDKLREFVGYVDDSEAIKDLLDDEMQEFITKLEKLPRLEDQTHEEAPVRFEPLLKKLIDHISASIDVVVLGDEVIKSITPEATKTNKWLIKNFRTMIENRWGMSIHERDDDGGEEQDEAAADIMQVLNEAGATRACLELLGRGVDPPLQAEAIKLIVALLFKEGGAHDVQVTIFETLNKHGSDLFFAHMRAMIQDLIAWHKWHGVIELEEDDEPDLPDMIILIRMLQLMCEGHYKPNQDIMREQPNNATTVNLLDDFVEYLKVLDGIKCRTSSAAEQAVMDVVLEVIQGPCEKNQDHFALQTELLETLNRRLRGRVVLDCDEDEECGVKKTAIDIFQGLLEGQGRRPAVYDRVLSVIHLDVIQMMSIAEPEDKEEEESDEAAELRMESLVLLQMLFDFAPAIRDELGITEEEIESNEQVACVEVVWRGELQRRFFSVPDICSDIAKSSKDAFVVGCDRESPETKLHELVEGARGMHREILHQQVLKSLNIATFFSKTMQDRAAIFTFCLALTINMLFIFYYKNFPCDGLVAPSDDGDDGDDGGDDSRRRHRRLSDDGGDDGDDGGDDDGGVWMPECLVRRLPTSVGDAEVDMNTVVFVLGIALVVLAAYNLTLHFVVRIPVQYQAFLEKDMSRLQALFHAGKDPMAIYYTGYLLFAVLSLQQVFHHLATFLLLDMIRLSPITMDTLNALWKPKKIIFMTILLTFIIVYVYAVFAFFMFNDEENFTWIENTHTLVNAFKEFLRYGSPSGSLNNDMVQNVHTYRWIFDVSWYMVTFTMWNVIKGITIDTFVELRQIKEAREEDTEERCFICGIDKLVFNRALGNRNAFETHIKRDQNLWNYVYYCIFIWEQDKDDDDGLEYYVRHCIDDGDLTWFPMNKAIRLSEHLEKGAVGSLAYEFRGNMMTMEEQIERRMVQLKDQVVRSIGRVEQALVFVPETAVKKPKKTTASPSGDYDSMSVGEISFRPGTTAQAFMEGDESFAEGGSVVSRANTATEIVRETQSRRQERLGTSQSNAYMDSMQCKIAICTLEDLVVGPWVSGGVTVRVVADTGIYNSSGTLPHASGGGVDESKESSTLMDGEPVRFNENEFFIVHGGSLAQRSSTVLFQVFYVQKLDIPEGLEKKVPSQVEKFICSTQVEVKDLVNAFRSKSQTLTLHIPQQGTEDAFLNVAIKCSEELLQEKQE